MGRRRPGGVPHARGRVDRAGPAAAGPLPRAGARWAPGVPVRHCRGRAPVRGGRFRRGSGRLHPGQPGLRVVRPEQHRAGGGGRPHLGGRRGRGDRPGRRRAGRRGGLADRGRGAGRRAGGRRGHGDVLPRRRPAVRGARPGLEPAGLPHRDRRPRRQSVDGPAAGRPRPRGHRRRRPAGRPGRGAGLGARSAPSRGGVHRDRGRPR